jgi:uncharacterized protein YybS (DUF2232 family)
MRESDWSSDVCSSDLALAQFFFPLIIILPGLFSYLGVALGALPMLGAMILSSAATLYASGLTDGVQLLAVFIPAAIALTVLLRKKRSTLTTTAVTCALMILPLWSLVCLNDILASKPIYSSAVASYAGAINQLETASAQLGVAGNFDLIRTGIAALPVMLPAMIFIFGMLGAFFSLLTARALSKRNGAELHPMLPFGLIRLPKGYMLVAVAAVLFAALARDSGWYGFDAVFATAIAAFGTPLFVEGIGVIAFLIKTRSLKNTGCSIIFILVLLTVVSGMFITILIPSVLIIGIYEQLFRLRARMISQ